MSAPLFLVETLPGPGPFRLDGPEGRHAADVQRLRAGEELVLSDGRGAMGTGVVTAARKGELTVDVRDVRTVPPPVPRFCVVQGLAKGDRGELAVQMMTEAGVDEIVPWQASRSIVRWQGDRGEKSRGRWEVTVREAAKQARRPWVPRVTAVASTKAVCARAGRAAAAFVLHEEAEGGWAGVELPGGGGAVRGGAAGAAVREGAEPAEPAEVLLIIGPEGGVGPDELDAFAAAGAVPVRLGPEVLRTSTAGVAALATLSVRCGRW